MAVRKKSRFQPNEIYFITFTILGWKSVFINKKYCELVFKWFRYMEENYDNKIHGYVIMPNHIHLLLYISDKSPELSTLIFNAKRFLAYQIPKLLISDHKIGLAEFFKNSKVKPKAIHKVFEPRYDSLQIQSRKFFVQKLNYIHNNPCRGRWRLVSCPEKYEYSSASNYVLGYGIFPVTLMDF